MDDEVIKRQCECPVCKSKLEYEQEEQEPGFRSMDYLICPVCRNIVDQSLSVEYMNVNVKEIKK